MLQGEVQKHYLRVVDRVEINLAKEQLRKERTKVPWLWLEAGRQAVDEMYRDGENVTNGSCLSKFKEPNKSKEDLYLTVRNENGTIKSMGMPSEL